MSNGEEDFTRDLRAVEAHCAIVRESTAALEASIQTIMGPNGISQQLRQLQVRMTEMEQQNQRDRQQNQRDRQQYQREIQQLQRDRQQQQLEIQQFRGIVQVVGRCMLPYVPVFIELEGAEPPQLQIGPGVNPHNAAVENIVVQPADEDILPAEPIVHNAVVENIVEEPAVPADVPAPILPVALIEPRATRSTFRH